MCRCGSNRYPQRGRRNRILNAAAFASVPAILSAGDALAARSLGIDVSNNNGTITWSSVANSGIDFAWAKATEGFTFNDSFLSSNMSNGTSAGVMMGAYHFARWDNNSAADEASHFLAQAGSYIRAGYMVPVLDAEQAPAAGQTRTIISTWINDWCNAIKSSTGISPLVYTYQSFASSWFNSTVSSNWQLWMANYNGQNAQTGSPGSITPWTTGDWQFWQYDVTGSGSVPGVSGSVDRDVANGDYDFVERNFLIPMVWTGGSNASWNTTGNWKNTNSSTHTKPASNHPVLFDTPVPGSGSTITLGSGEVARSLTFNESYTLTGGDLTLYAGSIGTIRVATGKTATINSKIIATTLTIPSVSAGGTVVLGNSANSVSNTIVDGNLTTAAAQTLGNLSGGGTLTINADLTVNQTANGTFTGTIPGTGALIKTGNATLSLTNSSNQTVGYTGTTVINAGTLNVKSGAISHSGVGVNINNGAALQFGDSNTLASSRAVTLGAGGGIIDANGNTDTVAGVISGTSLSTKAGAGILALSNTGNSYTGSTSILTGTLKLGASGVIPDSSDVSISSGATLDLNAKSETIGSLAGAGTVLLSGSLMAGASGASTTFTGLLNGSGSFTKNGAGTFTLANTANTQSSTSVTAGTLLISADGQLGTSAAPVTLNGGALRLNAAFTLSRDITINAGGGIINDTHTSGNLIISGALHGSGHLLKTGSASNPLHLWMASDATGGFEIRQGRVNFNGNNAAGANNNVITLSAGSGDIAQIGLGTTIGATTVTLQNPIVLAPTGTGVSSLEPAGGTELTLAGPITGVGGLQKGNFAGATGTVILTNTANSWSGPTTVLLGTLKLGASDVIPDASDVSLSNGTAFDVNSMNETIGSLAGEGSVTLGTGTLIAGASNASTAFNGSISGSGSLIKAGAGTMTISGDHTSFTGSTTVNGGKLLLASNMIAITSATIQTGSTVELSAGAGAVLKTDTLIVNGTGELDIQDSKAIITTTPSPGSWNGTNYDGVTGLITSGSIMSSATTAITGVGVALASDTIYGSPGLFAGQSVAPDDVLLMYTYSGDADLSGLITGDDYFRIDAGFDEHDTGYAHGDFNLDGMIDADDYFIIDRGYAAQTTSLAAAPFSAGAAAVPEPQIWGLILLLTAPRRRRRRDSGA